MLTINKQPDATSFSLNPIIINVTTSLNPGTLNLGIRCVLQTETLPNSGLYTTLTTLEKKPDPIGKVQFDLGGIRGALHAAFSEKPDLLDVPNINFTAHTLHNNKRWKANLFEVSGPTLAQSGLVQIAPKWLVRGGVPFEDYPNAGFWTHEMPNNRPWLTTQPSPRVVGVDDPLYFHYYSPANQTGATLQPRVHYADGTSTIPPTGIKNFQALLANMIYKVPAGFKMLGLDLLEPTKTPVRYTLEVKPVGLPAIVAREYIIDHDYHEFVRYFSYENSFGCMDVMRCTGLAQTTNTTEHMLADRQPEADFNFSYYPSSGQTAAFMHEQQKSIKCNTGHKPWAEIEALTDFFRSPFKFELVNGQWLPIELLSKKIPQPKEGSMLFSQEFEYKFLFKNHVWSPKRIKNI